MAKGDQPDIKSEGRQKDSNKKQDSAFQTENTICEAVTNIKDLYNYHYFWKEVSPRIGRSITPMETC